MRLRSRLLRYYKGGLTDEMLDRMDFRRVLGYAREMTLMQEAEAAEARRLEARMRSGQSTAYDFGDESGRDERALDHLVTNFAQMAPVPLGQE